MVPDYQHASPAPIPDGDTVAQPPRDPTAPLPPTRTERATALAVALLVLIAVAIGVLR